MTQGVVRSWQAEQRLQKGQGCRQSRVQQVYPLPQLLPDLQRIILLLHLKVGAQNLQERQIGGGPPVRHTVSDKPVHPPWRQGGVKFVEQARLPYPWFAYKAYDLPMSPGCPRQAVVQQGAFALATDKRRQPPFRTH